MFVSDKESQHFHTRSNSRRRNRKYLEHLCNIYSIFRTVVFQSFQDESVQCSPTYIMPSPPIFGSLLFTRISVVVYPGIWPATHRNSFEGEEINFIFCKALQNIQSQQVSEQYKHIFSSLLISIFQMQSKQA